MRRPKLGSVFGIIGDGESRSVSYLNACWSKAADSDNIAILQSRDVDALAVSAENHALSGRAIGLTVSRDPQLRPSRAVVSDSREILKARSAVASAANKNLLAHRSVILANICHAQ